MIVPALLKSLRRLQKSAQCGDQFSTNSLGSGSFYIKTDNSQQLLINDQMKHNGHLL